MLVVSVFAFAFANLQLTFDTPSPETIKSNFMKSLTLSLTKLVMLFSAAFATSSAFLAKEVREECGHKHRRLDIYVIIAVCQLCCSLGLFFLPSRFEIQAIFGTSL